MYNFVLFLLLLAATPYLLWQSIRKGKYRISWKEKLGFKLPTFNFSKGGPRIWIHVVSVGETRAISPLFKKIQKELPTAEILISSTTETGRKEAERTLTGASGYFFLPLDFSCVIRRLVRRINPDLLILVEGEFWYNLLKYAKKEGAKIALVNGKLSERSASRFSSVPFFTRPLFAFFDLLLVQSERYRERFLKLGIAQEKIQVTGNIKLDVTSKKLTDQEKRQLREELGIYPNERVLVIGSTHEPEEKQLLTALDQVWKEIPTLKVLLVPRHPERFSTVLAHTAALAIPTLSYTKRSEKREGERVILIDTMGLLHTCYQLADVAIVAGSFVSTVGGHNIFEPVEVGVPVLFGPHMHTQLDLVEQVLHAGAGKQVSLSNLTPTLLTLLKRGQEWQTMHNNCLKLASEAKGATDRTWNALKIEVKS